ncbi:hypothetical protein DKE48_011930 [Acinetobacter nosocomialis]|nr:hypothetical protein DKE48_011930 [Acinetobacter nosocomialis]
MQDHESIKPIEVESPSEVLTPEQQSLKTKMDANNSRQIELLDEVKKLNELIVENQRKIFLAKQIFDKSKFLKEQVQTFKDQISESLKVLSIENDIVTFDIDTTKIVELIESLNVKNTENSLRIVDLEKEIETCSDVVKTVRGQLSEPLQKYNEYLENLKKMG